MRRLARPVRAGRSRIREHRETRRGCRAHARVLFAAGIAIRLAQGLVRRVPHVRADAVAILVAVAIVVVASRGDPAGGRAAALEHAAEFLAERAREADGERVCAHASASDGVFAA